jgi:hypothetical protein
MMMKRHNNGISEEHIVAYLDGELNVNGEMREALGDAELHNVAREYAVLKKLFVRSASESRFLLTQSADSRALAYLQNVLHGMKPGSRMADDAAAMPSTRVAPAIRTKNFWAKRTTIGFAFALLLGVLWISYQPNEVATVPNEARNSVQTPDALPNPSSMTLPEPSVSAPAEVAATATPTSPEPMERTAVRKSARKQGVPVQNVAETPVVEQSNIVANQPEEKPADVMISRRYAKLIKNVRTVEITQQDKM